MDTAEKNNGDNEVTKWYVLRVISGKEKKVKEYLDSEIKYAGWDSAIKQVFVPMEKVYKVQKGKKIVRERNYYPGYIMLEAREGELSGEMIAFINGTTNIIHFLGKEHPIALRESEVNKMLGKADEMADQGIAFSDPFLVGESVKIVDGPFNDFNGVIDEVNDEKKKLKVTVKIFGRATPVELNYIQVERLS